MHDAFLHPFARPARPESDYVRIVRAEGSALWDADGNRYVDGIANLWNCHAGHGRREIIEAVSGQLATLDCYNTFEPFTNDVAVAAAEAIRRVSPHPDGQVFLGCSGSDAVDTALKLAPQPAPAARRHAAPDRGDAHPWVPRHQPRWDERPGHRAQPVRLGRPRSARGGGPRR